MALCHVGVGGSLAKRHSWRYDAVSCKHGGNSGTYAESSDPANNLTTTENEVKNTDPIDPDDLKKAVKEALKDWLNEKASDFGWWSVKYLGALVLSGLVYAYFTSHGWKL